MQNKMWMVGMMLIAFFVGLMFSQNTTAQNSSFQNNEVGRFQITATEYGNPPNTTVLVHRVDTSTGQLWTCRVSTTVYVGYGCWRWYIGFEEPTR